MADRVDIGDLFAVCSNAITAKGMRTSHVVVARPPVYVSRPPVVVSRPPVFVHPAPVVVARPPAYYPYRQHLFPFYGDHSIGLMAATEGYPRQSDGILIFLPFGCMPSYVGPSRLQYYGNGSVTGKLMAVTMKSSQPANGRDIVGTAKRS